MVYVLDMFGLKPEPSGNVSRIGLQRQPNGKFDAIGGTLVVMLAGCGMNTRVESVGLRSRERPPC